MKQPCMEEFLGIKDRIYDNGKECIKLYKDFLKKRDAITEEEILEHMTREMQIRGLISKEGSKSVFKREEMSTTELGYMVAIPHAMSNDSEEAVVSVMILKKPILWENEKVQVVLLLNVPKSQYNMWEVVFKRLYQYLIGDQGVTKLIKDKDYDDFIRHLERNE